MGISGGRYFLVGILVFHPKIHIDLREIMNGTPLVLAFPNGTTAYF